MSEEEIDRLSESMDNTVDYSATAMTKYEKILSKEKENMATDPPVTDKELAK